ncbi:hypothetical protein DFP72DRAFT_1070564 [Ephemerocybe angulata]|uniref:Uncharacterized protein n=1 Tax=Ephemerocybe angulata TaxID=980116 RepID=A0A8H6HSA2_9AGAR|nr:hypothetical protein DFP72DRAFT_1070564 [Tulosesus angulatus]
MDQVEHYLCALIDCETGAPVGVARAPASGEEMTISHLSQWIYQRVWPVNIETRCSAQCNIVPLEFLVATPDTALKLKVSTINVAKLRAINANWIGYLSDNCIIADKDSLMLDILNDGARDTGNSLFLFAICHLRE